MWERRTGVTLSPLVRGGLPRGAVFELKFEEEKVVWQEGKSFPARRATTSETLSEHTDAGLELGSS